MQNSFLGRWRALGVAGLALVLLAPSAPAFSQDDGTTVITIDAPTDGQRVNAGEQINIAGWAIDRAGPGTGVDEVQAFLDGPMGQGTRIGVATYGKARDDVAEALGNSAYTDSGFDLLWTVPGLSGGRHTIYVYARTKSAGQAFKTVTINTEGRPTPRPGPGGGGGGYYGGGYGGGYGPPGAPSSPYGGPPIGTPYGAPYNYGPPPPPYGGFPYGGGYPPYGGTFPYGGGAYTQTVTVVVPSSGSVTLTWVAVPFAQSYRIYQATAAAPLNFTVVQTVSQSTGILATNATVGGLTPGTTVYFQVRAVDPNGQESVVLASSGLSTFPGYGLLPPPAGVQVTATSATSATLTWQAVPGAVTYRVLVSAGGGPFVPAVLSNLTSTGATVSGLVTATTYSFQVVAVDAFGSQSQPSGAVTATTP
jgi:chitodextrinase